MRAARSSVVALATAALVSGGWGLAGLSFAAGVARARYLSAHPRISRSLGARHPRGLLRVATRMTLRSTLVPCLRHARIPGWDMNGCHTFYFDPNSPDDNPVIIQGQPPGPPRPPQPPCIPLLNCLPGP
jgi:hypothetical protein